MKHPGTPILYDTSKSVAEGGLTFRARFGVEHKGESILADGSYSKDSEIKDGYPEFTVAMLKKLNWDGDLTDAERTAIEKVAAATRPAADADEAAKAAYDKKIGGVNWKVDLSGGIQRVAIKHGCAPFGNAKARTVVWTFPDPIPLHREPLYTPRRDLLPKYPTYTDRKAWRLPTLYASIQKNDYSKEFPTILTSGRLVEYEGGGDESHSNKWLAELQQDMFCEVNPADAGKLGVKDGANIWVHSTGRRQGPGQGLGDRTCRRRRRVHAVPLRWSLAGQGLAVEISERVKTRSSWVKRRTWSAPTAIIR